MSIPTVMPRILLVVVVLLATCCQEAAARRSRRFPGYQGAEADVLNGIDSGEYDAIYVHYHGCVWSEFGDGYGCGDNGGDNNGDDASWYLGHTQCYRANVAYSLYGIRSDDKKRKHPRNICQKRRYFINSFFSNNGVDHFSNTVGLANGGDASSYCTVEESDDDGNNNENDGDQQREHGSTINANAHSYTTYCNAQGKFVTAQFGGAYCSDKSSLVRTDSLNALNNELDNVGCLLVYSKDQDAESNEEGEGGQGEDGDGEERRLGRKLKDQNDGSLSDLLAYSSVCSLVEYPQGCPDPYGAKKRFDLNASRSNGFWKQFMWLDWLTLVCFLLSLVLLIMAFCVYKDRRRRARSNANNKKRKSRWSSNTSTSDHSRTTSRSRSISRSRSLSRERSSNRNKSTSHTSTFDKNDGTEAKKKGIFRGMFSKKNNGS